ncbi:hypothetical protein KGM_214926 [Danaus plexippus plexippus]|uniref:Uncharacterized protein n=1 Tax=Danaus plexippus plexippus TaxID=278856 RepID=A0A212EJZ5_DANPL|nr:hypothetical protein KGM_214926 [Danaus plexippus plexippus]
MAAVRDRYRDIIVKMSVIVMYMVVGRPVWCPVTAGHVPNVPRNPVHNLCCRFVLARSHGGCKGTGSQSVGRAARCATFVRGGFVCVPLGPAPPPDPAPQQLDREELVLE